MTPRPGRWACDDTRMTTAKRISDLLRVDRLDTGERRLVRDLVVDIGQPVAIGGFSHEYVDVVDGNPRVTVPAAFVTDFSSIPALFRPFFPFSAVDLAGCVHDVAYRVQVPRKAADRMWEIVATSGSTPRNRISRLRGRLGYWGLRIGGSWAYRSDGKRPLFATEPDAARADR